MVFGAALLALALAWLRGFQLRSKFRKYNTIFEFTQACGICVGTPVRIRVVTVGSVVRVDWRTAQRWTEGIAGDGDWRWWWAACSEKGSNGLLVV